MITMIRIYPLYLQTVLITAVTIKNALASRSQKTSYFVAQKQMSVEIMQTFDLLKFAIAQSNFSISSNFCL